MANVSIAVILSGCGHRDGSEIHEAALTLWAIHKHGADYQCYAPDIMQHHVLNHTNGEEMNEKRNVFIESARISRGNLKKLDTFNADEHDALIIPGGLGAAKNLSSFAFDGDHCQVNNDVQKAVLSMIEHHKPIGALCIAPVILAKLVKGAIITIGNNIDVAAKIESMGAIHQQSSPTGITVDNENRVVTTPCYMYDSRVDQIGEGAEKVVKAVLAMAT